MNDLFNNTTTHSPHQTTTYNILEPPSFDQSSTFEGVCDHMRDTSYLCTTCPNDGTRSIYGDVEVVGHDAELSLSFTSDGRPRSYVCYLSIDCGDAKMNREAALELKTELILHYGQPVLDTHTHPGQAFTQWISKGASTTLQVLESEDGSGETMLAVDLLKVLLDS